MGAYLFVDMAHIAGLVAAGLHPSPVPMLTWSPPPPIRPSGAPRGGVILCKGEHAKKIDKAIFPGSQGGPLMHIITAKAVAFGEAMKPEFKTYQEQVLKNAQALAAADGAGLRSGLRRHGQPPDAGGSAPRPTSPARRWSAAWTRSISPSTRTPSPTTRRSPSSPPASRVGTPAAKMDDPMPREEKLANFNRLVALQDAISEEKHAAYIGKTVRCLLDGVSDDPRYDLTARTPGNRAGPG